ncbi:MAG TPA: response regulator, partial [Nitrososphaeraceae archaeon]|nr:response regulator [Nitrososphaeraceae archaeon]
MKKKKKGILIVDDEKDNASVFSIALEDTGLFEVDSFTDPALALSSFKSDRYSIAILDIKMPKMNGFELYEKIKSMDNKIKVCFLTAFGEGYHEELKKRFFQQKQEAREDHSSSAAATNVYFLRKPITLEELVKKVKE